MNDTTTVAPPDGDLLERAAAVAERLQQLAPRYDRERTFPVESFEIIRDAGLLAAPLSRDPGHSQSWLDLLLVLKQIGRGDLSVGRLYEGHVNALQLIEVFGTPGQVDRWSADARDRGMTFAVWNTEAADGVKIVPLGDGRFRLEGTKTFASGAGHVQRAIVPGALPDGGWQMCIVPMDEVRVSIDPSWWQPPGMHASTSFKVDFTGIELDGDWLLGEPGDYHRQPWFFGGAVRFAAVQLGGAEALLDATGAFLRSLDRTRDPHQRSRAGEAAILLQSGNLWLEGAASNVRLIPGTGQEIERAVNYAHMVRLAIERICMDIMDICERAVGARGLLQPEPMERIIRDLRLYLRQPAPDAALTSVGAYVLDSGEHFYRIWNDK